MSDVSPDLTEPDAVVVNLRTDGVLWMVNKSVFHPRGFALAISDDGFITLEGDGSEPWVFGDPDDAEKNAAMWAAEQDRFAAFEALLARAKAANGA